MDESIEEGSWQVKAGDPEALSKLLGIEELRVRGAEYDERVGVVILDCVVRSEVASCPRCGIVSQRVHQRQRRQVRDVAISGRHCLLEFTQRRFQCKWCARPFTESFTSIAPWRRQTRRYERYLFECCRGQSLAAVARQEGLSYEAVATIYYHEAERVLAERQTVTHCLGIDEIALKKGHQDFVLVMADLAQGALVDLLPTRHKATLHTYLAQLPDPSRAAIKEVSTDLWAPYRQVVASVLPHATHTADRFHVMQQVTNALATARRTLQRDLPKQQKQALKNTRWLLVKNQDDLSATELSQLDSLRVLCPPLAELHSLKEQFRAIFDAPLDRDTATSRLTDWIARARHAPLAAFDRFLTTLANWWDSILNYFNHRLTSGVLEGLNAKLKLIKRTAFGFRNFNNFRLRALIECDGSL